MIDRPAVTLIAEVSSNCGGDYLLAADFIGAFTEAGADYVKFQHTRVKHLRPNDPQFRWFSMAEWSIEDVERLVICCDVAGVHFLTTVYHPADVPELAALNLQAIKIGSGEAHEHDLAAAVKDGPWSKIWVSTGLTPWSMSPFASLRTGGSKSMQPFNQRVEFLRCITRYPCPTIAAHGPYQQPVVGWSDHCIGLEGCFTAIAEGATVIEVHVQLPNQARPPKPFEKTVEEFKALRAYADEDPRRFLGRWQHA